MKRIIYTILTLLIMFSGTAFAETEVNDAAAFETELTDAEKLASESYSQIRVLIKGNNYPFSYYEDGQYKGIYPEYLEEISKLSNIEFIYMPYESDEQIESYFTLGKTDALACAYGDWQGLYSTTDPYTTVEYNVVAKKGAQISKDGSYSVAVPSTDELIRNYIEQTHPDWEIILCSDISDGLRIVNRGKADITLVTSIDLQTSVSLLRYKKIEVCSDFSVYVPISMALSSLTTTDGLLSLMNKFIVCKPVWENESITRNYILNGMYVQGIEDFLSAHNEVVIIIFLIIAALLVLMFAHWGRLRKAAATDPLTKLWNKVKFIKEANKKLKDNRGTEFVVAVLDVEHFKLINDRFGLEIGNQTLVKIGSEVKKIFRGYGIFAHNSADEFVIMLPDTPENRERINQASEMDIKINNTTNYKLPIKVGVCQARYNGGDPVDITVYIDRAKIAKAKIKGHRDKKIGYFTQKMEERLNKENDLEAIMRKSLDNNDFVVYYQPKYSLSTNKIIGAEALVRWQHPTKGLISPGDFVPLFEKNGFIVEVDFYVYEQVMKLLSRRIKRNKRVVPISMNVSRCHLNSPSFTKELEELADKYKIPKEVIEMEITESIFSDEDHAAVRLMYDLKKHNFTLSMDDFGSGYSSLNLLRELPIDTLKIDKGFLDTTDDSARSRVIVEEIISMATKINIKTICEGVETEQQRDFLKKAGCDMAQGFFYARPLPQDEFEELLDNEK